MARGVAAQAVQTACGPLSDVGVLPRARMGRYEIELVQQKRCSCRASWQDCANMVGRSVHDVRLACDPDYAGDVLVPERQAPAAPALVLEELLGAEARVLAGLAHFEAQADARQRRSKEVSTTELSQHVVMASNIVGKTLNSLERRGLVFSRRTGNSIRLTCLSVSGSRLVEGDARG